MNPCQWLQEFLRRAGWVGFFIGIAAFGAEWHRESGYRWTELSVPLKGKPGFTRLQAQQIGIPFKNVLSAERVAANRILETGSGVAAGDYNGDGLADLFFCSLTGECALCRNLGNLKFEEATAVSGINCAGRVCMGAVFVDVDGDSDLDLLVSTMGNGVLCFLNVGNGRFEDTSTSAGTASSFGSMTLALADVDGNGTLDLYVTNYRTNDVRDAGQVNLQSINGRTVVPSSLQNRFLLVDGKVQEYGNPDLLYLNDGKGHFTPVSWLSGRFLDEEGKPLKHAPFDWGLTAAFQDLDGNGAPDLYVCNDYWTPDRIWMNDGVGTFRALAKSALRHTSASSMGVAFADIDRDGKVDFFVVDMLARRRSQRLREMPAYRGPPPVIGEIYDRPQINRNTLMHNRGDGSFADIACFAGLSASDWSWQPVFLDVDLDGYSDLLIASGHTKAVQDSDANEGADAHRPRLQAVNGMVDQNGTLVPFQKAFTEQRQRELQLYPEYSSPFHAFRNSHRLQFEDKTEEWGLTFPAIRHGVALADLDNDGDLDLIVNTLNSEPEIWINEAIAPRVAVELQGNSPNAGGIGANVTLLNGAVPAQSEEMTAGGKYLSGSQGRLVFAAGAQKESRRLQVRWRSGATTIVEPVFANRLYVIEEGGPKDSPHSR